MKTFELEVMSLKGSPFTGECVSLKYPGPDGLYGVMAGCYPRMGAVTKGKLDITLPDNSKKIIDITSGIIHVYRDKVRIMIQR